MQLLSGNSENRFPYTLQDIADLCGLDSIHTARKYLHDVLPDYERQGHGRGARYSEGTLNRFRFVLMLKRQNVLSLEQIRAVMAQLSQVTIDRVVSGAEPLEIGIAVMGKDGQLDVSDVTSSERTAVLISGTTARTVDIQPANELSQSRADDVTEYPAGERASIRYRGKLSPRQLEEVAVIARLLRLVVDQNPDPEEHNP